MRSNKHNQALGMRIFLLLPLAMLLGSFILGSFSYNKAKVHLTEELNEAMINLANSKSAFLASPDTIKALRKMKESVNQPIIYRASDLIADNDLLCEETYFQLALHEGYESKASCAQSQGVGRMSAKKTLANKGIVSDSIIIIPQGFPEGVLIELTGYTQCNMASNFLASDQRVSSILFLLSFVMFSLVLLRNRKGRVTPEASLDQIKANRAVGMSEPIVTLEDNLQIKPSMEFESNDNNTLNIKTTSVIETARETASEAGAPAPGELTSELSSSNSIDRIDLREFKLTPMQRRFIGMLLNAKDNRVGKYELCDALWDGKDNAEESLYTLVRRTKQAIKGSQMEIICNRGESYEQRINP